MLGPSQSEYRSPFAPLPITSLALIRDFGKSPREFLPKPALYTPPPWILFEASLSKR